MALVGIGVGIGIGVGVVGRVRVGIRGQGVARELGE